MKRICLVIFLDFLITGLFAQINKYGVPPIKNYSTQVTQAAEYNWSVVKDKAGVLYIGNDSKGVLRFDGHTWSNIPVKNDPTIRVIDISRDGVLYVGGSYEFGYIEPYGNGTQRYVSISDKLTTSSSDNAGISDQKPDTPEKGINIGEVLSMVITDSVIYFSSVESLFAYYPAKDTVEYINLRSNNLMQVVKIVAINNRLILADNISGLFEIKNKKIIPLPGGDFFKMKRCLVLKPFDDNNLFIGTLTDGVFKLDLSNGKVTGNVLDPALNEELKRSMIYSSIDLPSGERLLGTIQEGIYVFDKNYKLTGKWDSKTTDLADNTITGFFIDKNMDSELWILTSGYVSCAQVGLPFTEISAKSGLEGGVNNIIEFEGNIYLGTDLGLFKSYTDNQGIRTFKRVGNINDQVFFLYNASVDGEKFMLAASNQGVFKFSKDGSYTKIDEFIRYENVKSKTTYSVRSILQSKINPNRFYIGMNTNGLFILNYKNGLWDYVSQAKSGIKGYVASMLEDSNGDVFIYSGIPIGLFHLAANDTIPVDITSRNGLPESITFLTRIGNDIIAPAGNGIYRYVPETGRWEHFDELLGGYTKDLFCREIIQDNDGDFWITYSDDRIYELLLKKDSVAFTPFRGPLNPMPNLEKLDFKIIDNKYWIAKSKSVFVVDKQKLIQKQSDLNTLLTRVIIGSDSLMMNTTFYKTLPDGKKVVSVSRISDQMPEIKFNYNSVSFSWALPNFLDEDKTLYSYRLEGFDKTWSKWEKLYYKDFTNLPFGKYTFRVKARTSTDIESKEAVFEFYILKPWYLHTGMIILYIIAFILLIFAIIKAYTRKLKNENIRLEGIVAERTAVVVKQKEELESSIHYASRIQMALLPSEAILSENLKNYFILFKPRDIVSGDFYWMTKKENRLYIVAADCTGHGVPGAFMSLLGMSFLDEIIDKEKAPRADHILSELRLHVTESLKQSGGEDEAKDGMDMALLVIDFNISRIEFSGAYNPCFRVRKLSEEEAANYHDDNMEMADGSMSNGKYILETIYASKMPIGISSRMDESFVFYDWNLERGVSYYLFSDGYIDQFGGQHGRKFMKKNFKRLILDIQDYPMKRQKEMLDQNLKEWMGQSPQIDDILVMGIRTD